MLAYQIESVACWFQQIRNSCVLLIEAKQVGRNQIYSVNSQISAKMEEHKVSWYLINVSEISKQQYVESNVQFLGNCSSMTYVSEAL